MNTTPRGADADTLAQALAAAPPTAGVLDTLGFEGLSAAGRIDALVACEKHLRHAQALMTRALSTLQAAARHEHDDWLTETEVCAAMNWAAATAQQRLHDAEALTRLFPQTLDLLADGEVSWEQARALTQLTAGLEDDTARAVHDKVLARMPGQTVSATRQAIRRAILRADPQAAAHRHTYLRTHRCVELRPEDDGMATLNVYLPADTAQTVMTTLTTIASKRDKDDTRTLDQARADTLAALIIGGAGVTSTASQAPAIPATVHAVVSIETLLGLGHEPGHLKGYGPICAEQARALAHAEGSRWRFVLTSSDGIAVDASPHTYTPNAATARLARLKHHKCTFPACAMPADRCDLDHGHNFREGGRTVVGNLGPIRRKHHNCKSQGEWTLERIGDVMLWTSPTGHTYATGPTRYALAA